MGGLICPKIAAMLLAAVTRSLLTASTHFVSLLAGLLLREFFDVACSFVFGIFSIDAWAAPVLAQWLGFDNTPVQNNFQHGAAPPQTPTSTPFIQYMGMMLVGYVLHAVRAR